MPCANLLTGSIITGMAAKNPRPRLVGPVSRRLKVARTSANLSRRALAELVGMSVRAVNYYENPNYAGLRKPIYMERWAEVCGRDYEEIAGPATRPLARSGWSSQTPALALTG